MMVRNKNYITKEELLSALSQVKDSYERKIDMANKNGEKTMASIYSEAYVMLREDLLKELGFPKYNI